MSKKITVVERCGNGEEYSWVGHVKRPDSEGYPGFLTIELDEGGVVYVNLKEIFWMQETDYDGPSKAYLTDAYSAWLAAHGKTLGR